jgi:hypothetical protein
MHFHSPTLYTSLVQFDERTRYTISMNTDALPLSDFIHQSDAV